jgi:hypothetical protein
MTLINLSTAWLIGIAATHHISLPLPLIGLLALGPVAGLILWRDDPEVRRIAACSLFLLLGSVRYSLSLPDYLIPATSPPIGTRDRSPFGAEWSARPT